MNTTIAKLLKSSTVWSAAHPYWLSRYGYKNCPYEVEARAAESKSP